MVLEPAEVTRFGRGVEVGEFDRPLLAAVADVQPRQLRQRQLQGVQFGAHFVSELVDELARIDRFAQRRVVLDPAAVEVGGQVFVGVAPLVGADHPDFLAPQPFPQRLERADLVDRADDPAAAPAGVLEHQRCPVTQQRLVRRHRLRCGIVGQARVGVPCDQRQGVEHRPVGGVVRTELQHLEQVDQASPVVVAVGGLQRGLHRPPVHRALGLVLVDQLPQCLLPTGDRGEHHRTDRFVGCAHARFGDGEQDVLLAGHPFERVHQLLHHSLVGPGTDAVHRGDQQLDQGVGDLPLPGVQQRREQGQLHRIGMLTQVRGRFHRGPSPPTRDDLRRDAGEQAWPGGRPRGPPAACGSRSASSPG